MKTDHAMKNSFPRIYWQYAKESIKRPYLFINRHINRYSLTQDHKNKRIEELTNNAEKQE